MNDDALLQTTPPPPGPPKEALPSGAVYIGNSNTRGVVMQIYLQRFQTPLLANFAGLATVAGWLALGDHHWAALIGCVIGCVYAAYIARLWIDLLQDTSTNLAFWSNQLNDLVYQLGVKDYLAPRTDIQKPEPRTKVRMLYRLLKHATVAWVVLACASVHQLATIIGVYPWIPTIWKCSPGWSSVWGC